jgi:MinD superfamily P-loop ATPase
MVQVLEGLNIPFGIIVNCAGIGDKKIYDFCEKKDAPILLEIPFQRKIAELYSRGIPFVLEMPEWKRKFQLLIDDIKERIKK